LLGAEISLYIILFIRKSSFVFFSFPVALIIAFFDETIQIFSARGPAVLDVWIDFAGFASASVVFYTVAIIIGYILKNVNKNSQKQTVE
jgi:VanZ family protein